MSSVLPRECEKLRERLPEYADDSLIGPDRARLERHLAQCSRCTAELDDLRTVLRAVRSITPDEVPENLLPRLRQAVREHAPTPTGLPRLWPRLAVPVAVAVGLVAITFALRAPKHRALRESAQTGYVTAQAPPAARGPEPGPAARAAEGKSLDIAKLPEPTGDELSLQALPPEPGELRGPRPPGFAQPPELKEKSAAPAEPPVASLPDSLDAAAETPGPPAPSEEGAVAAVEREDVRARVSRGGGFGGGAGGASPRRMPLPPAHPGGRDAAGADMIAPAERGVRPCDEPARRELQKVPETEQPIPPFSAEAVLVYREERPAIALRLGAEKPVAEISVYLGRIADRQLIWRGASPPGASIVLTSEQVESTPAAIPVAIESDVGGRSYALFIPTLARLGQTAPSAPRGTYRGETLSQVLAEFTALTGLVVLAEEPLAQTLHGDAPAGPPDSALQEIAARAGLQVERASDIVFNLTHPR